MTEQQNKSFTRNLSLIAGEVVSVMELASLVYVFGTELGVLRIFAKYNSNGAVHNPKCRIGYSLGHGSWYFSINRG